MFQRRGINLHLGAMVKVIVLFGLSLLLGSCVGYISRPTYLDAVFANWYQQNYFCAGNGDGTFAPCTQVNPERSNSCTGAALRELDWEQGATQKIASRIKVE
jgi:hypothetical protein